jgi:hypothetical protein
MPILSSQVSFPGLAGIRPNLAFLKTNDTIATVTTTGYLTNPIHEGLLPGLSNGDLVAVITQNSMAANATIATAWYQVAVTGLPGDLAYSLITPTEENSIFIGHITIDATANPADGSLTIQAIPSTGGFDTLLANANMGQDTTIVIPDPGNANAQLLIAPGTHPFVSGDFPVASGTQGVMIDSGITAASVAALIAGGGGGSSVHSATIAGSFPTASTVITDSAITTSSVVIARFVSSANVVTIQTVLPAAGSFTVTTDTAPSTGVLEYISFTPSAALLTAGVVVGKVSFSSGPATFVIADPNITAGMVVTANFASQGTPSEIYTATAGAGTITFVVTSGPGVAVMQYAAMLPGNISALGLHAANYSYAGGFASIVISDASITASSIVTADFKSQAGAHLIQKVTPSAGTLTILASADPGVSVIGYIATASAGGGGGSGTPGNIGVFGGSGALSQNLPSLNTASTTSATPGTIRSITGQVSELATTMTSGNLVGVRGVVNYVGASGGFLYGVEGKLIPTGTLSGSSWNAGVFGQLDISAATINAGQTAPLWGDYGATSGTLTNTTGMYGIAMTNTTAAILGGQIYLVGGATNLLLLNTNAGLVGPTYVTSGASGTPGGVIKKLAISIDGTTYYIVASTSIT